MSSVTSSTTSTRPVASGLVILDYGSQYTLLIARRLREIGVYCEVVDGGRQEPPSFQGSFTIHGIILSGGPDSTYDIGARRLPSWILTLGVPVLGICYGMQLLIHAFGGKIRGGQGREYGRETVSLDPEIPGPAGRMFYGLPTHQTVWMSHGDDVEVMPTEFTGVAHTSGQVCGAVVHRSMPFVGLQFHPEVQHTEYGKDMLKRFVTEVCRAPVNWNPESRLKATVDLIRKTVGDGRVLVACSGGVDSTVAAAVLSRALGPERVTAVFCDTGLMRKNEVPWVSGALRKLGLTHVEILHSAPVFLKHLAGVVDPEQKRKLIGKLFIEEFQRYAAQSPGAFTHLGQGTLYPDVIESAGHGAGSKVIKSHHNVGGLPETLHLALVEPFRFLFKDEVRELGEELGLPHEMVYRHPFPGPGLAIRIVGAVSEGDLHLVREADDIFIKALRREGLYDSIWQAFCVLMPIQTVGVMGDNRTYQKTLALRAVTSRDGMTAEVGDLPISFLSRLASEIVNKVPGINRVVYDITTKPPATIEWE